MNIKVCGNKYPENINDIRKTEPDFLGFIFYVGSPRFINDHTREYLRNENIGASKVGVFVNSKVEEIVDIARENKLDYVQLHGDETIEQCAAIKKEGIKVIKAFQMHNEIDWAAVTEFEEHADFFLFDNASSNYGGSGHKFNWELLRSYPGTTPYFLSGGIKPEDAKAIKSADSPLLFGIDINSGFEIAPGKKDETLVVEFINEIRKD